MSGPPTPLPTWFRAVLIVELVLGLVAAGLLLVAFLAFSARPSAIDTAVVIMVSSVPLVIVAVAAALARVVWRRGHREAAMMVAFLPVVLGVPFLAMLFGIGL